VESPDIEACHRSREKQTLQILIALAAMIPVSILSVPSTRLPLHWNSIPENIPVRVQITVRVFAWQSQVSWKSAALKPSRMPRDKSENFLPRYSWNISGKCEMITGSTRGAVQPLRVLISNCSYSSAAATAAATFRAEASIDISCTASTDDLICATSASSRDSRPSPAVSTTSPDFTLLCIFHEIRFLESCRFPKR
jgi:hypothetical protein